MTSSAEPRRPSSTSQGVSEDEDRHEGQLSPFVCACFTLNYLIGTGFLTLPWAFETGGIFLSSVAMALTCFVSALAADYILNACARADALVLTMEQQHGALLENQESENKPLFSHNKGKQDEYRSIEEETNALPSVATTFAAEFSDSTLASSEAVVLGNVQDEAYKNLVKGHGKLLVSTRKFELTELVSTFLFSNVPWVNTTSYATEFGEIPPSFL